MSRRALSDNLDLESSAQVEGPGVTPGGPISNDVPAQQRRFSVSDAHHMRHAIELSAAAQPHPNPRVGAVVVVDDKIIASGAHQRAGEAHAEVLALDQAGERAHGATVFVTLEPCSHFGKTPPCSKALIEAGVAKVVVGAVDPDDRVHGSGIDELRAAGIDVATGLLSEEVEAIDPGYFHHRRTGLPLVTLKLATTLDGQIAAADRTSKWVTGEDARRDGHQIRAESDVVIVGAGTVIDDNPRLDVRLDGYEGPQPRPVIVGGMRALPTHAALYDRNALVYTAQPLSLGVEQVAVGANGRVDLGAMIEDLGARGYVTAMVEGGATLATALIKGGHVDRIIFHLAAKLGLGAGIGAFSGKFRTIADAVALHIDAVDMVGEDIRVQARVGS